MNLLQAGVAIEAGASAATRGAGSTGPLGAVRWSEATTREELAYCPRCKPSSEVSVQPGGLVICLACGEVFIFGADLVSRYLTERDVAKPKQQRKPMQRQRQVVAVKMSVKRVREKRGSS